MTQPTTTMFICYDGSDAAKEAIERAAALVPGARALVVHAWQPMDAFSVSWGLMSGSLGDFDDEIEKAAVQLATEGAQLARTAGLDSTALVVRSAGSVAWSLLDAIKQEQPTLVVVGATGRSSIGDAITGSIANALAHRSPCPVLLVHATEADTHAAKLRHAAATERHPAGSAHT